MPVFSALFANFFAWLGGLVVTLLSRKIPIAVATMALLASLIALCFYQFVQACASWFMALAAIPHFAKIGVGLVVSPLAPICWAAWGSTWACTALYGWQRQNISIFLKS